MSDIADWLNGIGLGHYCDAFQSNGIDFDSLAEVTNDDLKDIGVAKLADRKQLLKEIERLVLQRAQSAGERRLLTMLFCDLVGSTPLSQQLDPEELRLALRRYQDTVLKAITKYGGVVANFKGDGVMAYFGWPRPDEDQAGQAVRAALETVAGVSGLDVKGGVRLRCRVGIASGLVVVGGEDHADSAYGETPNLAARLQSAAGEDRVVIDKVTRNLIGQAFLAEPLPPFTLKGFDRPVEAWEVIEERKYLDRFDSRPEGAAQFANRTDEMQRLLEGWKSIGQQRGLCCVIRGEAGMGKSRLVREFELRIRQENCPILRYQCSPYHTNSAFYPVIQRIENAAGFSPQGEPVAARLAKVKALYEEAIAADSKVLELLAELLSIPHDLSSGVSTMSPVQRRQLTISVLVDQAVRLAQASPVLLLLEDAHWIDPSTLELLQALIKRTAQERVFVVVTTRPGRDVPLPAKPVELALPRLSDGDVARIAVSMRGAGELSDRDVAAIVARVDGVPLFAEELTSTLVEHKADDRPLDLPENVQSSVMARLDMLGSAKYVAQVGSIMGKEFKHAHLAALATGSVDLGKSIAGLVDSGLLLESDGPDKMYSFKHALVRDVAYESLLREHRRRLHERLVREVIPDEEKERVPELVAHHLTEAGLVVEALDYWKKAGYRAARASANSEAIAHFNRGLALIRELPEDANRDRLELAFLVGLCAPTIASTGYTTESIKAITARALVLSRKFDDAPEIFPVLYSRWGFLLTSGSIAESFDVAREFSALAERQNNKDALYARYRMLGASRMCLGELDDAAHDLEQAIALYTKEEHERLLVAYGVDIRVAARCFLGEVQWLKGYPDSARKSVAQALKEAKEIGHTHSVALSLFFCALVSLLYRDQKAVHAYMEEMGALAQRHGAIGAWPILGRTMHGWARLADGELEEGLAMMNQGMEAAQKVGITMFMQFLKCRLAEILLAQDRVEDAERILAETDALLARTGDRNYEGELCRLKGELHWRQERLDEAERQFGEALAIARRQKAKAVELRAAVSYARLLAARGEAERGRSLVSGLQAWFEEGHGCHDLAAAEAAVAAMGGAAAPRITSP